MNQCIREIEIALESLEMVYNFHFQLVNHNEIMWKAVRRISKAVSCLKSDYNQSLEFYSPKADRFS